MTAFSVLSDLVPEVTEQTLRCSGCGNKLPLHCFTKPEAAKAVSTCKECLRIAKAAAERSRKTRMAQAVAATQARYAAKAYDYSVAQPRTTPAMEGTYVPPTGGFVRNGGHKHIRSKGI